MCKTRTVKLDHEGTQLLFEARSKLLKHDPKANIEWYNVVKIALKAYLEAR